MVSSNFCPIQSCLSLHFSLASKATVERASIIRDYYYTAVVMFVLDVSVRFFFFVCLFVCSENGTVLDKESKVVKRKETGGNSSLNWGRVGRP